ncbi:hypothetical protein BKA64DRAFT_701248 [Cadophora sp. MPI-SDFR-AT-0126]|nr:hypothetical protein BKA64DRAFT_701248 [Leotiomycetes sp. MPI-SDFR-AT-0126]
MAPSIQVPPNTLRMTCPESRRRRFTTKENEERILLASKDWEAKRGLRDRRRQGKSAESQFSKEVEKAEEELELKECFLKKLAREENTLKAFSGGNSQENIRDVEPNVQKAKDAGVDIGAKIGSLTLAHRLRWRSTDAGVDIGAKIGSLTLAHRLRWRSTDAGVDIGAKIGSLTLAHRLRWRSTDAGADIGAKIGSTLAAVKK